MPDFVSNRIECPFYISGTAQHIVCESALTPRGSSKHYFQSKTEKARFVEENCCKNQGGKAVFIIIALCLGMKRKVVRDDVQTVCKC